MIFFGPLSFISHNHKELSSVKEFLCEMTMDSIRLVGFETKCLFLVALPTTGPPTTYPYFGLLMELNFPSRPIRSTSHSLRSPSNPIWGLNVSLHQRERDSVSSTSQFFAVIWFRGKCECEQGSKLFFQQEKWSGEQRYLGVPEVDAGKDITHICHSFTNTHFES